MPKKEIMCSWSSNIDGKLEIALGNPKLLYLITSTLKFMWESLYIISLDRASLQIDIDS
jgi:hypothetical protein